MLSDSICFSSFNELYNVTKAAGSQSSDYRYVWNFYRNSEYNYEYLNISVTSNTARYKSNDEANSQYIEVNSKELNAFAQTIFNYVEDK